MKKLTLGETRIRINLQEIQPGNVFYIKSQAANLINLLEEFKQAARINNDEEKPLFDGEKMRLISKAQTAIEDAADMAVKAVTDGSENEKDIVSFANYVISKGNTNGVTHADFENWKLNK